MMNKSLWLNGLIVTVGVFLSVTKQQGQELDVPAVETELLEKARKNIEQYRKGNVTVRFQNTEGKPKSFDAVLWKDQENEWIFSVEE